MENIQDVKDVRDVRDAEDSVGVEGSYSVPISLDPGTTSKDQSTPEVNGFYLSPSE